MVGGLVPMHRFALPLLFLHHHLNFATLKATAHLYAALAVQLRAAALVIAELAQAPYTRHKAFK
jgi:hypothetical protein